MANQKTKQEQLVSEFLKTGKVKGYSENDLAQAIDQFILIKIQHDLRNALKISRKLIEISKPVQGEILISAYRAHARSAHLSALWSEAEKSYLAVRELSKKDPVSRAKIDRILIDIYMYLGDYKESKKRANLAFTVFNRYDNKSELAKAKVNYANLLHRQDRHREAEALYNEAGEYFFSAGDKLSASRCFFNRANTLVQLFDFKEAEKLYKKSEKIYLSFKHELDALDASWGLSWLYMLQAKFHIALTELNKCEEQYKKIGVPLRVASCELDRAEVFLNLNLYTAALESSRKAENMFSKLKAGYEIGKAALYRAHAAFVLDKKREGKSSLAKAIRIFKKANNDGFLGTANFLGYQYSSDKNLQRNYLRKAATNFSKAQLPLWQAICDIHRALDEKDNSAILNKLQKNEAVKVVPYLFATWQTILGDKKASEGDREKAIYHWSHAANRLDQLKSSLPPIGFRDSFARNLENPHTRLVKAELDRDPISAAIWSEKNKTAGIWSPTLEENINHPSRNKIEEHLKELSNYVAAFSSYYSTIGERSIGGIPPAKLLEALQRKLMIDIVPLEKNIKSASQSDYQLKNNISKLSREISIVQFHIQQNDIIVFVHENGSLRVKKIAMGNELLYRLINQWRFNLESNALSSVLKEKININDEYAILSSITELIWTPLEISEKNSDVLIIPEGYISNIPWSALRSNNTDLSAYHRFVIAPSIRHFLAARKIIHNDQKIHAFIGKSENLPLVENDLKALQNFADKELQTYNPCTRKDIFNSESANIWHFSGHALLDKENPFYSSLLLSDGPLFAADLRLQKKAVNLVTLAACQTGTHVAPPGAESTGLVRSFLEMGARNVLAGYWPVADDSTSLYMENFYKKLSLNSGLSEAAQFACLSVKEKFKSAYHWAPFAIFGAGNFGASHEVQ